MKQRILFSILAISLVVTYAPYGLGARHDKSILTVYSGRSENLIGAIVERFEQETGIEVAVRYGETSQMAATILEEGKRSPADLFFAQDAGALGALTQSDHLAPLSDTLLAQVEPRFRSSKGQWVGISGRARVVVYNTEKLTQEDLPVSLQGFCDPSWKGRIGWAPANGSFQSFVTAFRVAGGDEAARAWLQCIRDNEARTYPKNTPIVAAVGAGEIDVGFVNHYYLYRFLKEHGSTFAARNYCLKQGDPGALINVAGIGILKTSRKQEQAKAFIAYLLSERSQRYFAEETYEYPLLPSVPAHPSLTPLIDIQTPKIDLSDLDDLRGTLDLLHEEDIL